MIIYDTETTGLVEARALPLEKQPKVVEFAAVKLNDKTLVQEAEIEFLVNPGIPLTHIITKITGLTDGDLAGKPPFVHYYPELCDFFRGETTSVAHNHEFDLDMLDIELRRIGKERRFPWPSKTICTVEATFHIKGRRMKLDELYELATKAKRKKAHRAIVDVKDLATCVRWMRKEKLI